MQSSDHIPRSLIHYAFDDELTGRHMVFVAGARQVGKTSLARRWLEERKCRSLYYSWDDPATRRAYLADGRFFESAARSSGVEDPWIVFDEIHKRTRWRDILKGVHDVFGGEFRFLVTGSARLDLFRRGGDSLVGRHTLFHMMPLTLRELTLAPWRPPLPGSEDPSIFAAGLEERILDRPGSGAAEAWGRLLRHGPFPEPLTRGSDRFGRRWHADYLSLVTQEDLRDVSRVIDVDRVENLLSLLPGRVASPLSMASLARDLEVAHTTVKAWLEQLRRLYVLFPVPPWTGGKVARGLRKEQKWYFLDWYHVPEPPARFENMVATSLFTACAAMTDLGFGDYRLHYVRTTDGKEIDFLVSRGKVPMLAVEVKTGDTRPSGPLVSRQRWVARAPVAAVQVVATPGILGRHPDHTWVVSADRFLSALG